MSYLQIFQIKNKISRLLTIFVLVIFGLFTAQGVAQISSQKKDSKTSFKSSIKNIIVITKAYQGLNGWSISKKSVEVILTGTHFGTSEGDRRIKVGSLTADSGGMWTETEVVKGINLSKIIYGKTYPVYMVKIYPGGTEKRISNIRDVKFLMLINKLEPAKTIPGKILKIDGSDIYGGFFGDTQGAKAVKIGGKTAQIVSWADKLITVRVPSLPAGTYPVYIEKNGAIISKKKNLTVTIFLKQKQKKSQ